jgi:hypothetical protein
MTTPINVELSLDPECSWYRQRMSPAAHTRRVRTSGGREPNPERERKRNLSSKEVWAKNILIGKGSARRNAINCSPRIKTDSCNPISPKKREKDRKKGEISNSCVLLDPKSNLLTRQKDDNYFSNFRHFATKKKWREYPCFSRIQI